MSRLALFALAGRVVFQHLARRNARTVLAGDRRHGAKSNKGLIRVAVSGPRWFPDCGSKAVRTVSVPLSAGGARVVLGGLAPANYAVSLFHDANANGKLDTFAGIPREGYGLSRNPLVQAACTTLR